MPYQFNIDHNRRLVIRKTWGVFTEGELAAAWEEYDAIPEIKHYHELFDFLGVTSYEISSQTVASMGMAIASRQWDYPGKKIALVARQNTVVWGLLRMYSSYEDRVWAELRLFDDLAAAETWLTE